MKFTTLIMLRFNDGLEVPDDQIEQIIDEFAIQCGGCSDEGIRISDCGLRFLIETASSPAESAIRNPQFRLRAT
jgi:hypothetical protein